MSTVLIVLGFLAIPAAFLAFKLFQNHQTSVTRTASTCGDIAHAGGTLDPAAWFIGPDLSHIGPPPDWGNKSPGMPPHPEPASPGFILNVPVGVNLPLGTGDKLDSLAFKHGPLTGKKQIAMSYRVELSAGAELLAVPEVDPAARYKARMTVYFQRDGDDWSTEGKMEAYRWYYTGEEIYLEPGDHELVVPLDRGWTATQTSTMASNPPGFKNAIANTCCVGFGFGGNEVGRIHGMRATGPAKITVTKFEVS